MSSKSELAPTMAPSSHASAAPHRIVCVLCFSVSHRECVSGARSFCCRSHWFINNSRPKRRRLRRRRWEWAARAAHERRACEGSRLLCSSLGAWRTSRAVLLLVLRFSQSAATVLCSRPASLISSYTAYLLSLIPSVSSPSIDIDITALLQRRRQWAAIAVPSFISACPSGCGRTSQLARGIVAESTKRSACVPSPQNESPSEGAASSTAASASASSSTPLRFFSSLRLPLQLNVSSVDLTRSFGSFGSSRVPSSLCLQPPPKAIMLHACVRRCDRSAGGLFKCAGCSLHSLCAACAHATRATLCRPS